MVLSLASLIPAPQADRKDPVTADGAPRRSARGDERAADQARFGAMIEPAKPLPPQASPRATEARATEARSADARAVDARSERPAKDHPVRPDPLRERPRDTKPERADPSRDAPLKTEKNDSPERSTPLEDRPGKEPVSGERVVCDAKAMKEQAEGESTAHGTVVCATPTAGGDTTATAEQIEKIAVTELSGEVPAGIESAVQTPTDLLTEALAALAQHLEAQIESAKSDSGSEQGAPLAEQGAGTLDATAMQIAAGMPAVAVTPPSTTTPPAPETTAPAIAQVQAASPQSAQAAMLAALTAEVAADGAGGEAKTDETGAAGEAVVADPDMPKGAKPALATPGLVTPDFATMIGSQAKATTATEAKPATAAVGGVTSGEAKAKIAELLQPAVKSVPDTGPKAVFAEWMQDFAAAHGATHRSGDLMSSLDRLANGLPAQTGSQDVLRPTPLQMLPVEIGMQAMRGVTRFQIRLDPAELGRVDVKLEIRENGEVEASLVVDRVETLALLKRDANTLHQAFEQAGLKQSPDGLQFSLRGEGQKGEGQGREDQRPRWPGQDNDEALPVQNQIAEIAMRRMMIPNSSIDRII